MIRPLKGFVLALLMCSCSASADTNDDLSLLIKELQYLEKIAMEMKQRNSNEKPRVGFSYERFTMRLKGLREGIESHMLLVQSVPKWDRLGVETTAPRD